MKIHSVHSRDPDFVEVAQDTEASEGAGRSIGIGLKDAVKTKLNNFKGIQKEETNIANLIYPVDVADDTAKDLPIKSSDSSFIEVALAPLWQRVRVEVLILA